jgi:diguanylate cyclase (GGDEF)-like protein/PAS domain S-box-containing protein
MYFRGKEVTFVNYLFAYILIVSTIFFISYQIFIDNFKKLEENQNRKDINVVLSDISTTMKEIKNITNGYVYGDEFYESIKKNNVKYISEKFQDNKTTLKDLELDFIILMDMKNKILFSKYGNDRINSRILETKLRNISKKNKEFHSLFEVNSKIFYLKKSKIRKDDNSGKFNGFIYTGKFITDKSFVNSNYPFEDITIKISDKENNYKKLEINYLYSVSVKTTVEDKYFMNKIDFFDIFDNYIFSLEIKNPMKIIEKGKKTILLYNLAIACLIFIIFLIIARAQRELSNNNEHLEAEINSRTKKLNEYVNIVNNYVTISSTDLEGNITDVSEAFCRISGYSKEELIGNTHKIVKHEDMDPSVYTDLWETITSGKKWVGEIKNKKKNGDAYWVLANIDPTYSDNGKMIGYTSIRQEITDKKRVEKLSVTDKLTQLYNRVRIEEIFNVEIAKFHRYNTSFSMIIIDIDYFKEVNDTYGHNVGDVVLQEIAGLLRASVRIEDVVGRWGGEEFVILSNNYSVEGIISLAEKIRKNIAEYNFTKVGHRTASFGISTLNKTDTQESMIYRADKSLYHAKKTGRNKVCLH